ncbi:MAG TPA: hypothetical protein VL547_05965 [Dinghuibacter sp.]|nr:hypothetical protein [Dinghuibacter sp.]
MSPACNSATGSRLSDMTLSSRLTRTFFPVRLFHTMSPGRTTPEYTRMKASVPL